MPPIATTNAPGTPTAPPNRTVPLRMRPDLIVRPVRIGSRSYWHIKDPVSLRYFQLRDEEYFLLRQLTGQVTFDELRDRFERAFAPLQLGKKQLQVYLATLQGQGITIADVPGQGGALLQRRQLLERKSLFATLASPLAIRFRGVDPEHALRRLYPLCRWLFSPVMFVIMLAAVLAALTLVVVQYETIATRLPSFQAFFNVRNLVWIAAATAFAKVLHEFGHALACKHFGGECHEMGVMLLVFTPCLYCNVSDAWLMKNKWHRVAIGAAGILVETVLASVCTFLWWFSEPGLLNTICLNIMFVCSVSTLLFNGNPLLRYDGYYVLSDIVDVPNLRQRASQLLASALASICCGVSEGTERQLPTRGRWWLAAYGVAATIYPLIVITGILWFLYYVLRPYGLTIVAEGIAALLIATTSWLGLRRAREFYRRINRSPSMNRTRIASSGGVVLAAAAIVCWLPLPQRVSAPATVEARDAQRVFVTHRGRLAVESLPSRSVAGERVQQGDVLAVLENPEIDHQILALEGNLAVLRSRENSQTAVRVRDERAGATLVALQESIQDLRDQLVERQAERQQLTLVAPVDGVVLPDESRREITEPNELSTWNGTPLDAENAGCTLESGDTYCLIGDPSRLSAILVVEQANVDLIQRGQPGRLWFRELPGQAVRGTVKEISRGPLDALPAALVAGGELAVLRSDAGKAQAAEVVFYVRIDLEPLDMTLPLRSTGWGKIEVSHASLASRVYRYLARTFRFV